MKVDNFVPFSRPQSGTVNMQLMTELDVSYNLKREQQYQNRLESKTMRYFSTRNRTAQCTYFENYITDSRLKMLCVGIYVKPTLCSLF